MLKYLKKLHKIAESTAIADYTVVVGNQAADMDSCCSALLVAYLESKLRHANTIPLITIPRSDLRLRRDIEFVFQNLGINADWLLFNEDLVTTKSSSLFLVDHNAATVPGIVKSIIDHHEIEDPEADLTAVSPLKIVKSGSCMSAIINYYYQTFEHEVSNLFAAETILVALALSPIAQDTNNLTKKVEDEDRKALGYLNKDNASHTLGLFSPFESFELMKKMKSDLSGLTVKDLLRKDYKCWGTIGISSLPKLFEKLAKKGLQDLPGALERYRLSENLDIMIALASGNCSRTDSYVRQLAYCGPPGFNIQEQCPELQLEFKSQMENVVFYNQLNTTASRKQVAPAVKEAYRKYLQG